jgi:hypothetical protein
MRAALDVRNYSSEGIAREMRVDGATLRRWLSDTYPGCLPVDQLHGWWMATGGDLSPVRTQLHLCGVELSAIESNALAQLDGPRQTAELSSRSGELVALLIEQWSDGKRTFEERRESLPLLCEFRAALDRIIVSDEAVLAGVK